MQVDSKYVPVLKWILDQGARVDARDLAGKLCLTAISVCRHALAQASCTVQIATKFLGHCERLVLRIEATHFAWRVSEPSTFRLRCVFTS